MNQKLAYQIYPLGDQALTLDFGNTINIEINQTVMGVFHLLQAQALPAIIDIIPAYSSISVVYNSKSLSKIIGSYDTYQFLKQQLESIIQQLISLPIVQARKIVVPACYHPSLAPDLLSLAESHQLSAEELIKIHCTKTYRVYMIGFLPGFAYMGTVDERIISARKSEPRLQVPAGSVGIAGAQTGIYPFTSPGGWQLIARTPITLFDVAKQNPTYLPPGDEV